MKLKYYLSFLLRSMIIAATCLVIISCTTPGRMGSRDASPADAVPKNESYSRGGTSSYKLFGKQYHVRKTHHGYKERGIASWYGKQFHGRLTSNGERYDMYKMTAAHKSLPLPCYVKVTNLENKKTIVVRVNDRGPFHGNRIIDLSYAAAKKLGMDHKGTAKIEVEAISSNKKPTLLAENTVASKKVTSTNTTVAKKSSTKKTTIAKKAPAKKVVIAKKATSSKKPLAKKA